MSDRTTHDEAPDPKDPGRKQHILQVSDEEGKEHAVKLDEESYKLVQQAQELTKNMDDHQFQLGKLALEYAPMKPRGGYRRGPGQMERTAEFAALIGVKPSTIRQYRTVVHSWRNTDVKPGEFQWRVLQQNVRVAEKQAFVDKLREEAPHKDTRRWQPTRVRKMALDEGLYTEARGGRPAGVLTTDTKVKKFTEIANRLRDMKLEPGDREKIDPLLSQIQAECDRLRRELIEVAQKEAAAQAAKDAQEKKIIDKERLLPKAGITKS